MKNKAEIKIIFTIYYVKSKKNKTNPKAYLWGEKKD